MTTFQNQNQRRSLMTIQRSSFRVVGLAAALLALLLTTTPHAATGTLVPPLYQTVLDSNGNPVSGAKVCTYLAGTTTPVATYTDVGLTTPSANPITADTAGRWAAYLSPGSSYKFLIQDATGTAGVCNGATIRTIDNVTGVPSIVNPTTSTGAADVRLTLTPGLAVTTADVTAATTLYATPDHGNRIALYDGAAWNVFVVTETAIPLAGLAANVNRDVYAVGSGASVLYAVADWLNDSTRTFTLALQDGVLVRTGLPTWRYIGTFRTTGTIGQTEDSATKRYVWNYAHRVRRPLARAETVTSWTYGTATWRQANAGAANQVALVVGVAEAPLVLSLSGALTNTTAGITSILGIGADSTTAPAAGQLFQYLTSTGSGLFPSGTATLITMPAAGYHFYTWLEYSNVGGTTTWQGVNPGFFSSGLLGWMEG